MAVSSAGTQQNNHQLIEIRKVKGDFATLNNYLEFRDEMLSMAIQPWFKTAFQDKDSTKNIPESIWAIIGCKKTGIAVSNLTLLAYEELEYSITSKSAQPHERVSNFTEWVNKFNPICWGDWLMVPKLYLMHLRTKENLPIINSKSDPWLDAVLRESRGVLMWSYQFIEITRMIANVSITEAAQMRLSWVLRDPDIKETLEKIHYPRTQQSLCQCLFRSAPQFACKSAPV